MVHIMGKIVKYKMDNVPEPSKKDWARVKAIKDKDIDFSDIPEITDFSEFHPYKFSSKTMEVPL